MRKSRLSALVAVASAIPLVVAACSGDSTATDTPTAPTIAPTVTATAPPSPGTGFATLTPQGGGKTKQYASAPPLAINPSKQYFATLATSKGNVRIQLLPKSAPQTVNSFVFLARDGYFNGILFHRVVNGFMVQSGDPLTTDSSRVASWGTGTPGYTLPDEFLCTDGKATNTLHPTCPLANTFDKAGVMAMANTGQPHTSGSQFFITLGAQTFLNGGYTLFGQVVSGQDVVQAIGAVSTACSRTGQSEGQGCSSRPDQPVVINSVSIEEQ
ncbi:MAG: peptidylprolyl isomerase [Chloroflexi bacterium]|nr:peptidylprolyl isomerase [Chloroflexota bacterium]